MVKNIISTESNLSNKTYSYIYPKAPRKRQNSSSDQK